MEVLTVLCGFSSTSCDMMELRRRYQSLYIPSDFFDAVFTWVDAFPLTRPFQLSNACNFHILHKEVDPFVKNTAVLDPPDANHTYSAKVGLSMINTIRFTSVSFVFSKTQWTAKKVTPCIYSSQLTMVTVN